MYEDSLVLLESLPSQFNEIEIWEADSAYLLPLPDPQLAPSSLIKVKLKSNEMAVGGKANPLIFIVLHPQLAL